MKKEYLIIIFLLLGPILDVTNFLGVPISVFVRGLYLVIITLQLLIYKKDLKLLIPLLLFGITSAIYQLFYLNIGIMQTVSATLKFSYLPISLLFFKNYEFKIEKEKILSIILIVYIGIYLFSYLFGISANIYEKEIGKHGFKGLFSSVNEFSAIVSCLLVIVTSYFMKLKKWLPMILLIILSICCALLTGTKIFMGGILFSVIYLLWQKKDELFLNKTKKVKMIISLISITIILVGGIIFTKTRTYQNMIVQQKFFKVENVMSIEFLDKVVYNNRLTFLDKNMKYFEKQNILKIFFGIGMEDTTVKMIEIDIFDIMLRYGIIGVILFIVIVLISIKWKEIGSVDRIAIILLLIISLTSGHVLIYPAVCIYIAVLNSRKEKV